jgi:hypothetical protein
MYAEDFPVHFFAAVDLDDHYNIAPNALAGVPNFNIVGRQINLTGVS